MNAKALVMLGLSAIAAASACALTEVPAGSIAVDTTATVNSTLTADMLTPTYAAGGVNPRPGAGPGVPSVGATGATQAPAYVTSPAVSTTYRGAFLGTAPTLWTAGWTALNKTNTEGIKLLVD